MSGQETGANASPGVVASRRNSAVFQAPKRRPEEEPNRSGQRGGRGGRDGGRRDSSGELQPAAAGPQEPPLCFALKNDWVGTVIGRGGSKIRDTESTTNTKIQIIKRHSQAEVKISGSKAIQTRAKAVIDNLVKI